MMLLIRCITFCLGIKAERLMEQPFTSLYIHTLCLVIGLIATAAQFDRPVQIHGKSMLFRLRRMYIKESCLMSYDLVHVTV